MGKTRKIIAELMVVITVIMQGAVPALADEIVLNSSTTGGLITAGVASLMENGEDVLLADKEEVLIEDKSIFIDDVTDAIITDSYDSVLESDNLCSIRDASEVEIETGGVLLEHSEIKTYTSPELNTNEILLSEEETVRTYASSNNEKNVQSVIKSICDPLVGTEYPYEYYVNGVSKAGGCQAFAMSIYEKVFGYSYYGYPSKTSKTGNQTDWDNLGNYLKNTARPGDVLRAYCSDESKAHAVILYSIESDSITYYESEGKRTSNIVKKTTKTYDDFKDTYHGRGCQGYFLYQIYNDVYDNIGSSTPIPDPDPGKDMGDKSPYNPEIEDGKYVLMSALRSDTHLNIEGNDKSDDDDNVNVERGFDEDSYYDVFKVSLLENGYYKLIQNGTNHMAVSVAGRSTGEDANIQMYYWNPEDLSNTEFQWAIKWAKKQDGKPYHYLRARCSGMYMTTAGSSNGRNVYQASKDNDDDYQKWFFARYMKPSIETDSLPNGSVGQSYSATLEADSDLDVAWTFTGKDDSLPPGLSLERNGKITGTPTTPGTYTFSLDAENALVDALGLSTRKYTIVIEGDIPVTGVTLDKSALELNEGASATLTAAVSPDNATDKSVTWKSSDEKIATVSSSGKVTAVKEGTATITVTSNSNKDKGASCKVTVKKNNIPVTSVTLDKTSLEINAGATSVLTATVKPDNATDKTVTWKSSDEKIATVNSSGKVTAVKEGTATITVTSNSNKDKSASCKVTVKSKPTGIVIKADDVSGAAGSTVSVPVRITGNPGLGGLTLTITSDPVLTLESIDRGSILSSGTFEPNKSTGLVQWYTSGNAAMGDGILFTLKFSIKNGTEKKNYPVNIAFKDGRKENVADINGNTLNVSLIAGSVNTNRILGDITGDGIIAIGDVVRLARAVAGNIILTDDERAVADINGDKVIAIGDVVRLARYVEGSITEL